jgi:outer membrane protein OmpA-like peptidoglycan-associated protein
MNVGRKNLGSKTIAALVLALATGCGAAIPPPELVNARKQLEAAKQGPAAEQSPADLHTAKQALAKAEAVFADQGDSRDARDLAYVALRKAELAEATARLRLAQVAKDRAEADLQRLQTDALTKSQSELAATRAQMEKAREQLERSKSDLEREKQLRLEAEKKAEQALADLRRIAEVKQESRGMVITLSGGVLFPSGEATLLPGAVVKLNEVAEALTKGNPDSNMLVEGHTDSQGTRDFNQTLGQKRAQAVRDHLVSRGVAADRIKAVGVGQDRPIADNKSPEGRANNRRVEIIVEPPTKK